MSTIHNKIGTYGEGRVTEYRDDGPAAKFADAVTALRNAVIDLDKAKEEEIEAGRRLSGAECSRSNAHNRYVKARQAMEALLPPIDGHVAGSSLRDPEGA